MLTMDSITHWLKGLPDIGIYIFLGISSIIENVFPPFPGDTVTVFCGFLAAHELISLPWAFLSVLIGNLIGAYIMYFAGERILNFARQTNERFERPVFIKKALSSLVSQAAMEKTKEWFLKWGALFVLLSRFSAGIRFFVSIIAGITRMNLIVFSITFSLGVLIWNSLLLIGGFALGDNWEIILEALKVYNQIVIFLILVGLGLFLWWKWRRKQKQTVIESIEDK